jgi:hypothetical protein
MESSKLSSTDGEVMYTGIVYGPPTIGEVMYSRIVYGPPTDSPDRYHVEDIH